MFFIIATDTEQLQHAIKVVYGQDFNAQIYLSRFFDARFSIPEASLEGVLIAHCKTNELDEKVLLERGITVWPLGENTTKNIVSILDAFNIPPRDAIQACNKIISTIKFLDKGSRVDILFLTTLFCLQACNVSLYRKITGFQALPNFSSVVSDISAFSSKNKVFISVADFLDKKPNVDKTIRLVDYFNVIIPNYVGLFKNVPKRGNDTTADMEMMMHRLEGYLYGSLADQEYNSQYNNDLLLYSYSKNKMFNVAQQTYRNLSELAFSFD
ncbi:hypothetical protein D3C80_813090 [compost metagenome]